jgi:hypothetical protein
MKGRQRGSRGPSHSSVFRTLSLALTSLACATSGPTEQAPSAAPPGPSRLVGAEAEIAYYQGCARLIEVGEAPAMGRIDFARMRRASLYVIPDEAAYEVLQARLTTAAEIKDWPGIVEAAAQIQAINQADIRAHLLRALALHELKRDGEALFEEGVTRSLVESIVSQGVGDDYDVPWTAYRTEEIFDVLRLQGYIVEYQSLYKRRGRSMAHVRARRLSDGHPRDVYFDVGELVRARADRLAAP